MEGDWSSREGRLGSLDPPDYCVPERDLSAIHLSQVSLDGGYGGSEACSSEIFHHCQQPSYAHSEGYYSYVSSTDSITPFIDRLKRELEFTEAHENSNSNTKWEETETDGFREKDKTATKENDSVWHVRGSSCDIVRGSNNDLATSYRHPTRRSSPPLSSDSNITFLSRVPLFHNASYESVNIDHGPRFSSHPANSHANSVSRPQTDSNCLSSGNIAKSTRVQSSNCRSSEKVHSTRPLTVHNSDRDNSELPRPTRLANGSSCETPNHCRGQTPNRDTSNSVQSNRTQPVNHSRVHSNQNSSGDPNLSFSNKISSSQSESGRVGPSRNDPLTSSFRLHKSSSDSLNSRSHSGSETRLYSGQNSANESANIARSSRVAPPQRHLSQSVLYLSADHRKLFPISTYQPEPPRVVGAVSVSERVTELESRLGGLKALQKKALLSYYQRHQAAIPAPPPPPRRASSASDYLQLKGCLDSASSCSGSSQGSKEPTQSCNSSPLRDTRQHHSRSCGSLSGISGPVIVGRSISVDDWVPARPPKSAHLRARPPSPEPPPPPPSPPQQYSDEPLPPPPGPDELPAQPPSLPSRHPSPGPQVPTSRTFLRSAETRSPSETQYRPLKTPVIESRLCSTDSALALDTRPQKLIDPPNNHKNHSTDLKLLYNGPLSNFTNNTGILGHQLKIKSELKDIRPLDTRPPGLLDNVTEKNITNSSSITTLSLQYHRNRELLTSLNQKTSSPPPPTQSPLSICKPILDEFKDEKSDIKPPTHINEVKKETNNSDCEGSSESAVHSSTISLDSAEPDLRSSRTNSVSSGTDASEPLLQFKPSAIEPARESATARLSPLRTNTPRPPSRNNNLSPSKSDEDKLKLIKDDSRFQETIKEARRLFKKPSFRCSDKIQQSIDSLHNSLRTVSKDTTSSLDKNHSVDDVSPPVKLSDSLADLTCLTLPHHLSSDHISSSVSPYLSDNGLEKDIGDKTPAESDTGFVSSQLDSLLTVGTLQQKKEELVTRLSRKLSVLRAEAAAVSEETTANEELGEAVVERVATAWGPREAARLRSHVADLGRLTALLLTLTTRLARADNALLALSSCHPDKGALETKRDRLAGQLEEARRLKEKVDKRNETVTTKLRERLTPDEYTDFMHFVSLKSKLLLDSREIADKIKLGEEQLQALQMTLSAVT